MNDLIDVQRNPDASLTITIAPSMADGVASAILLLANQIQAHHAVSTKHVTSLSVPKMCYGKQMKLTKQELAESWGVTARTINQWMSERLIPYRRIGNVVRFDLADVEQSLQRFRHPAVGERKRRMERIASPE